MWVDVWEFVREDVERGRGGGMDSAAAGTADKERRGLVGSLRAAAHFLDLG